MTQRAVIAALLANGTTYRGLGEALGIDPGAARMRARRAGLRTLHRTRPPNPETPRRLQVTRRMLAEGCEIEAVAERLGMTVPAVRMMLRRAAAELYRPATCSTEQGSQWP